MIYNGNIFHAFRKVIPSLSHSKIEAIKALGINFWKNHSAIWLATVLSFVSYGMYSRDFENLSI